MYKTHMFICVEILYTELTFGKICKILFRNDKLPTFLVQKYFRDLDTQTGLHYHYDVRHQMETFSALLVICAGNSPVTGEFPAQSPVTRSCDVFFKQLLNKRLSKQWWGWWFETPSCPLWRYCDVDPNPTCGVVQSIWARARFPNTMWVGGAMLQSERWLILW